MTTAQSKRQKLANSHTISAEPNPAESVKDSLKAATGKPTDEAATGKQRHSAAKVDNFGVDVDDLTDNTDSEDDDDELDELDAMNGDKLSGAEHQPGSGNHLDIQEQLAAAGPAGVAAAAAIASARKRKRPHSFETNPSVRKRQQTRLIRKLRACIDEYTIRVGQQAVVLITMPGKTAHNFKVFGAQPLESVIRACKHEIMAELEQALLEQAPQQFKEDTNKHELPALVIDGIPTPVEKMTQAQLRAFIPLMLKYSTGRGKPGWGKDTTRPPWWPETLPWANVRSDARDESEKQRISWTTTLRQIVTNCYKYHGRDDLLPTFDENEESLKSQEQQESSAAAGSGARRADASGAPSSAGRQSAHLTRLSLANRHQQQQAAANSGTSSKEMAGQTIYSAPAYASNFVHTIANGDGTMSLIQVDPANAQIFTLPDGTQVRAVRLQTLGAESLCGQALGELQDAAGLELGAISASQTGERGQLVAGAQAVSVSEASLGADGQIIVTGEDGLQSCYPMSSLVSIPASMYQQFAQGGQQLSIVAADGSSVPANAVSIHTIQEQTEETAEPGEQHQQQVRPEADDADQEEPATQQQQQQQKAKAEPAPSSASGDQQANSKADAPEQPGRTSYGTGASNGYQRNGA